MRRTVRCCLLLLALACAAFAQPVSASKSQESNPVPQAAPTAPQQVMNKTCPVMEGEPVGDDPVVIEYEGKKINLCCKKCKQIFLQEPQRYIKGLPQFAVPADVARATAAVLPLAVIPTEQTESTPFLDWLGRFHVVVVHFPIALILFAGAWECMLLLRGRPPCAPGVRAVLAGGVAAAAVAIGLGLLYEETMDFVGERHAVLELHELYAWSGAGCAALALLLSCWAPRVTAVSWAYRVILTASAVCIGLAGHAGGRLTQGLGFFSRG